uniref:NEDD8-activating enzyme E1 catalytic subunit n=1 Tax=Bionectria ochroleuca TaxID=29856 RepID=A0A8H7N9H6_BIOOC
MSHFRDIHVIDMDTIDISNLNRQFLFRKSDVGKYKAEVAARFVEQRVKGVKITAYNNRIQDFDESFYKQFQLVICGLDSIEARRWINAMLVSIAEDGSDDPDNIKPLVDGGTEGFKGQARVILPTITSCIECQLDMHAPRAAVPLCTIASIPRQPEHCVEWAHVIAWDEEKPFPSSTRTTRSTSPGSTRRPSPGPKSSISRGHLLAHPGHHQEHHPRHRLHQRHHRRRLLQRGLQARHVRGALPGVREQLHDVLGQRQHLHLHLQARAEAGLPRLRQAV